MTINNLNNFNFYIFIINQVSQKMSNYSRDMLLAVMWKLFIDNHKSCVDGVTYKYYLLYRQRNGIPNLKECLKSQNNPCIKQNGRRKAAAFIVTFGDFFFAKWVHFHV